MSKIPGEFFIQNLRGGLNDFDTPHALMDDQCVMVENIDFSRSTIGGRRLGSDIIDLTSSTLNVDIVFLGRNTPSIDAAVAELWGVSTTNFSTFVINRKTFAGGWTAISPTDAINNAFFIRGLSLHGKYFLAYSSAQDRLHVWDGTSLRRTGLATPAAPSVANTGAGTYAAIIRYYRIRYTVQSGGVTLIRSEPSAAQSFTPSGTGTHARVTKPSSISEGETHWELEASADNVNFYLIATTAVGTTTFDDNAAPSAYPTLGPLSEDIGDYTNIHSARFLAADEDRLIVAGTYTGTALASRVAWTPVFRDEGSGNDERIPLDSNNFVDLDGLEGGGITDMAPAPLNGYIYIFKRNAIYKLIRTGNRLRAYEAINITKSVGALTNSVVMGEDEYGAPCIYFLDPRKGPHRIGARGIEWIGYDIQGTISRLIGDTLNSFDLWCIYYPTKRQVMWGIGVDADTACSQILVGNVREFRASPQGLRRGWAIYKGRIATSSFCATLFADNIDSGNAYGHNLVPFLGMANGGTEIHRTETGTQDNGTNYQARLRTKPFVFGNLLSKFGVRAANLMAKASSGVSVNVTMIRNHGEETIVKTALLTAGGSETRVIKPLSEVNIANVTALQIELGDNAAINADWELDALALMMRQEETQ